MEINLHQITIRDITAGYVDDSENGVVGYGGKLNIRPKYQREFIYGINERNAVINTIKKGFPLNVMYWVECDDGSYELLDGQQRTVSFCQYVHNEFSLENRTFENLTAPEKEAILNYEVMVYICRGNDREQLDWFETINIAGKPLTNQEMRNAIYSGTWVTDAKSKFSKSSCAAYNMAKDYLAGTPIRQEYLETAIFWKARAERFEGKKDEIVREYMSHHQKDSNADQLWLYFRNVIDWVKLTFNGRPKMKGIDWAELYDEFHEKTLDKCALESEISQLMKDSDVTNKSGIYHYVLTRKEKYLNIRQFSDNEKMEAYEKQNRVCAGCGKPFDIKEMEGDHITPWCEGGKTEAANCQMLCKECNRKKGKK